MTPAERTDAALSDLREAVGHLWRGRPIPGVGRGDAADRHCDGLVVRFLRALEDEDIVMAEDLPTLQVALDRVWEAAKEDGAPTIGEQIAGERTIQVRCLTGPDAGTVTTVRIADACFDCG